MQLGYKSKRSKTLEGYKIIKDVEGIDIKLNNGHAISIREHGYKVTKNGITIEDVDFDNEENPS